MIRRAWQIINHPGSLVLIWGALVVSSARDGDVWWTAFSGFALGVNFQRLVQVGEEEESC